MTILTQSEFARQVGVSRQAVNQAIRNGRISVNAHGQLDLGDASAAQVWDSTASPLPQHEARRAQFQEAKAGGSPTPPEKTAQNAPSAVTGAVSEAMPAVEKIGAALKLETYKLQKARAERENIAIDQAVKLLVERAEVDFVLADLGNILRGTLEGMADRLAPVLAAHRGDVTAIHRTLEDTAHDLLAEMAAGAERKMDGLSA